MNDVSVFDESIREMALAAYLHASHFDDNVAAEYAAALSHGDLLDFLANRATDQLMCYFSDENIESWRKSRTAERKAA